MKILRSRNTRTVSLGLLLVCPILAGCGASTVSAITGSVKKSYEARKVSCELAGVVAIAGGRSMLYNCAVSGIPLSHRIDLPARDLDLSVVHRCFVDVDGFISDITTYVEELETKGLVIGDHVNCQ